MPGSLILSLNHSTFLMPFPVTLQVKVTLSPSLTEEFLGSTECEEM